MKAPVGALFRRGNDWAAFVIDGEQVRLVTTELGQRNDEDAQIIKGLSAGQTVVLHPPDTLTDGARISVRCDAMTTAACPNIGPRERQRRLVGGFFFLAIAICVAGCLLLFNAPRPWRLLVFLPAWACRDRILSSEREDLRRARRARAEEHGCRRRGDHRPARARPGPRAIARASTSAAVADAQSSSPRCSCSCPL